MDYSLCLASVSPRREQILSSLGFRFSVKSPTGDEAHPNAKDIVQVTQENAYHKAASVLAEMDRAESIVIGADTLVLLDQEVLGKPRTKEEVVQMLQRLSGKTHTVVTGLALVSPKWGQRRAALESKVTFKELTPEWLEGYASVKEPYDKAGSYAVQGLGVLMIEKIEGSYTNVMGLPVELLLTELAALTKAPVFEFFK